MHSNPSKSHDQARSRSDVRRFSELSSDDKDLIRSIAPNADKELEELPFASSTYQFNDAIPVFIEMSTVAEDGVMPVRSVACDLLLARRVEAKLKASTSLSANSEASITNLLYIANPRNENGETTVSSISDFHVFFQFVSWIISVLFFNII
ncbi:unnamed protein product [Protopolystoma xenopodis]|uniref:Uncharacterized protein n=1 Tax=Protopolystoma xenopodis TaxID=117903 RepID=A0A3S5AWZ8_9PLAT|nr:unnamed protein product [Protopolystoma xenopodis]